MTLTLLVLLAGLLLIGFLVWRYVRRSAGFEEPGRGPLTGPDDAPIEATPLPPRSAEAQGRDRDAQESPDEDAAREVGADFYDEIIHLLEAELAGSPQRGDLRFKLLEMYAATHRKAEFLDLARRHHEAAGPTDPYWPRVAEAGHALLPNEPLFASASTNTREAAPTPQPARQFRRYYESVDPALLGALETELHAAFQDLRQAAGFWKKLRTLHADVAPLRTPVVHVSKLSDFVGGAQIYVRHEASRPSSDAAALAAAGQVLLAQSLGRKRVVAALAGAGHAESVARAAAKLGLSAEILVTASERAERAEMLASVIDFGATVTVVADAAAGRMETQRAALSLALSQVGEALFVSPLEAGPFPYPVIVQELQGLAGRDLKSQMTALTGRGPNGVIVSTADGMSAIGVLQAFVASKDTHLFCVETGAPAGPGTPRLEREHAWLRASGRVRYSAVPAEVARFAARHCMPDEIGELGLCGGEVLVETFTLARQFSPDQVVAVIVPSEIPPAAPA